MKKVNDKKLYLYFGIVTLLIAILLGIISVHSRSIENKVEKLFAATDNVDKSLKEAYMLLRNPHIFGGYDNFTQKDSRIKKQIKSFDTYILNGEELAATSQMYLRVILTRRVEANTLTINTLVFVLLLVIISFVMFFVESRQKN